MVSKVIFLYLTQRRRCRGLCKHAAEPAYLIIQELLEAGERNPSTE